jgi:hypothetical protein
MRETSVAKAERLLTSGRVVLVEVHGRYVRALVRGDSDGFHVVEHDRGIWTCDCSSYRICSHRRAVMQITAPVGVRVLPESDPEAAHG